MITLILDINGKKIELSFSEAESVYYALGTIFKPTIIRHPNWQPDPEILPSQKDIYPKVSYLKEVDGTGGKEYSFQ